MIQLCISSSRGVSLWIIEAAESRKGGEARRDEVPSTQVASYLRQAEGLDGRPDASTGAPKILARFSAWLAVQHPCTTETFPQGSLRLQQFCSVRYGTKGADRGGHSRGAEGTGSILYREESP